MTTFGDDVVYHCPSCGKPMKMLTYNSYTVRGSEVFSDGYRTGRPRFTPDFAKCPYCGRTFFRHNVKSKKVKRAGAMEYIKAPELKDLLEAARHPEQAAETKTEEMTIRMDLWRTQNDRIRWKEGKKFTGKEMAVWLDNCEALLSLCLNEYKKENSKRQKNKNLYFTILELYRNLGRFEECLSGLENLPPDYSWQKALLVDRCAAKKRMVFEMNINEGYRLRPRRGKGWESWDCGTDGDSVLATIEDNDLIFNGRGPMRDYALNREGCLSTAPWCKPSKVKKYRRLMIDDEVTSIGAYAFYGSGYSGSGYLNFGISRIGKAAFSHSRIFHAHVPEETTEIEEAAFSFCGALKSVDIRNGVRQIGDKAFLGCGKLSKIELPLSISSIGKFAFAGCDGLTEIVLGRRLKHIGKFAFRKRKHSGAERAEPASVTNHSPEPQIIDDGHFMGNDLKKATLYVVPESVGAYKAAEGWRRFGEIKAIEEKRQGWYIKYQEEEALKKENKRAAEAKFYEPETVHVWIGTFAGKDELYKYTDNAIYEDEYYTRLIGDEDYADRAEPENCAFCRDYGLTGEDAADVCDDLDRRFFEKALAAGDILNAIPVEFENTVSSATRGNGAIYLYNRPGWRDRFKKAAKKSAKNGSPPKAVYLGEFEITEPEDIANEGRYDGEI